MENNLFDGVVLWFWGRFGFIKVKPCPAVRRGKVFVHLNEVEGNQRLKARQRVCFYVVPEHGKGKGPAARKVKRL